MEDSKTPERLAAVRAAIESRRAQRIAEHDTALEAFDADLAAVVAVERIAAELAERYSVDKRETPKRHKPPSKKRRPAGAPRAPYSPIDDERIMEAGRGIGTAKVRFGDLAPGMGRSVGAIERHYQELKKRPPDVAGPATPDVPDKQCGRCAGRPEGCFDDGLCMYASVSDPAYQMGSENTTIVEASQIEDVGEPIDSAPWEPPPSDDFDKTAASSEIVRAARAQEATKLRRPPEPPYNWPDITKAQARVDPTHIGRSITGAAVDNGPTDRRRYDHPGAYTSKGSDC